ATCSGSRTAIRWSCSRMPARSTRSTSRAIWSSPCRRVWAARSATSKRGRPSTARRLADSGAPLPDSGDLETPAFVRASFFLDVGVNFCHRRGSVVDPSMMLGLALASLAPTAEAAPVAVEFEDSDALLRGVVIQRLLEGGRVLAPAGSPAAVHLSIRWLRHSVLVEGWWGRSRVFREIDHGDPELAVLEVAHGTLDVLERLGADEPEATVVAERVTLEFVGFLPDPRLYAEVTQALLDAGFVVIGRGRGGDWSLCVWQGPEGTYAADRVEAPPCPEQPSVAGDASLGRRVAEVAEH